MRSILVVATLAPLALVAIASAFAWYPGWGRGMGYGMEYGAVNRDYGMNPGLNPTPEELSQWADLRSECVAEILPLRNQLFSKRMELSALLAKPEAYREAIKDRQKEVIALQGQIQEKAMDHQLAFRETLNPEQLSLRIARKTAQPWYLGKHVKRGCLPMGARSGLGIGRGRWDW